MIWIFLSILVGEALVTLLYHNSLKRVPEWISENSMETSWVTYNKRACYISTFFIILSSVLYYNKMGILSSILATLFIGSVSYLLVQSLLTDLKLRLVARKPQEISIISLFFIAGVYTSIVLGIPNLITFTLLAITGIMLVLLPLMGASDGRAFMLILIGSFPLIGLNGILYTALSIISLFLIIAVFIAIYKKSMKFTIPAVPIILFPSLIITLIYPMIFFLKRYFY